MQHCPVPPGDGGEEAKHLLDDAVQVVEAVDVVKPEGALADAAVVEDALAAQLLPQFLQHPGVFEELHDQRGAGASSGGIGSEDELQGAILKDKSKARVRHRGWADRQASRRGMSRGRHAGCHGAFLSPRALQPRHICKVPPCAGTGLGHPPQGASHRDLEDTEDQTGRIKNAGDGS